MHIEYIRISNYRSIVDIEIKCDKFNIFVGQNNHGKSNIFEALGYFFNGDGAGKNDKIEDLKHKNYQEKDTIVKIAFVDIESDIENMKNEKHKTNLKNGLNDDAENKIVIIRRNKENRVLRLNDKDKKLGADNTWNDLLPKFEHIDARQHAEKENKVTTKNNIGRLLNDTIKEMTQKIVNEDSNFKDFKDKFSDFVTNKASPFIEDITKDMNTYLQEIFNDCSVSFNITPPSFDDLFKNISMKAHDGVETDISNKGDGVQRAVVFAIIRYISEKVSTKSMIFAIDEAELHLHPSAQRKMEDSLYTIAENGGQVFINTHSPVFLSRYSGNNGKKIFKVEKNSNETKVCLSEDNHTIIYDLLGGLPSDLLFPDNFLIVEGDSEEIFLKSIIEKFYKNKPRLHIVNAKTNSRVSNEKTEIENIFGKLENTIYKGRAVGIIDNLNKNDLKAKLDKKLNEAFDINRLFKLKEKGLEKFYPKKYQQEKYENKVEFAKEVSSKITQKEFEGEMGIIFNALCKCWDESYKERKK